MYFYSKKENTCYNDALKSAYIEAGTWPDDLVEISDELFHIVVSNRPFDRVIQTGADGMPVLATLPPSGFHNWSGVAWVINQEQKAKLDSIRAVETAEKINAWRDQQEQAGFLFVHADRTWDGGVAVATRLQNSVKMPELPAGFYWTDAGNSDVPMTLEQLTQLNAAHDQAIFNQGFRIHDRQRTMKAEVEKLSGEALAGYVVGWPV